MALIATADMASAKKKKTTQQPVSVPSYSPNGSNPYGSMIALSANAAKNNAQIQSSNVYSQEYKNANNALANMPLSTTKSIFSTVKPATSTKAKVTMGSGAGSGLGGGVGFVGGSASYTPQYLNHIDAFSPSSAYTQAMEYTNSLLEKLNSGRTSYTDKVNEMMSTIENRAKFSYDQDTDPMFQNYLNSAMESGKTAMADTMGQASALTGGYGSSYATAAANGAYNEFIKDAYDSLPQFYGMALDAYNSETNDLYNKLNMYNNADATEYSRLANAYQLNYAQANDMYNREYSNYWDTANFNNGVDQFNANMDYQSYWDNLNYNTKIAQDNADRAYKYASLNAKSKDDASAFTYKEPTETQMSRAIKAFESGGEDELYKYIGSLPENVDVESIMDYATSYGTAPLLNRTYTNIKDTFNWLGGVDNNDVVQDEYGNKYKLSDLQEKIKKANPDMSDDEIKKFVMQYNKAR